MEVLYSSDVIIGDPEVLSTLAIFYDRVELPAATLESLREFVEFEELPDGLLRITAEELKPGPIITMQGRRELAHKRFDRWEAENRILFAENVLVRLHAPDSRAKDILFEWLEDTRRARLRFRDLIEYRDALFVSSAHGRRRLIYISQDHLIHLFRADLNSPAVFVGQTKSRREVLKAVAATETFKYLLPAVGGLHPDEILRVREKVAGTREGFSMHLQALSADIEARVKADDSLAEIARHARAVVETKLIPDFREFRRQLLAERSGFWLKVLQASRQVFEIEAAPWTPRFYGQLLAALGVSALTSSEARRESLSNRSQAFQFMAAVEDVDLGS